jgi:periplasmic divalent cation tolerance protein
MENKYIAVFVTAANISEAKKIAAEVLHNKLAACANIVKGVESSYWWRGKIEKSYEAMVIMKTRGRLMKKLTLAVKKVHSYSVPEIIAVPIASGSPDYLKWIDESVGATRP